MDVYGVPGMDELLDLSNDEFFSSSTATIHSDLHCHCHASSTAPAAASCFDAPTAIYSDFPDAFCVHSEDVAELEWLSNYMDDSITDFPVNSITGAAAAFYGSSRSIRSRSFSSTNTAAAVGTTAWCSASPPNNNVNQGESLINRGKENTDKARRCTHCSTEKTPQWRTGPMGPKTLCNACGVRNKSGRLVPEYRPAASPTFVLTRHSNSHRKVLELRLQKELLRHQQLQPQKCNDITFRFDDVI